MALNHKWNVKNDFAYVLQFFSLICESLGSVNWLEMTRNNLGMYFLNFCKHKYAGCNLKKNSLTLEKKMKMVLEKNSVSSAIRIRMDVEQTI